MKLIHANGKSLSTRKEPKLTNGLILNYSNQLEQKRLSHNVDYYIDRVEIHAFYQRFEKKLLEVNMQVVELRKKYFEYDETGNPIFDKLDNPAIRPQLKLKEGMTREGYQIEINELMKKEV